MKKKGTKDSFLKSPKILILIMATGFFLVETAEMLVMPEFDSINEPDLLLIDALIPTLVIAPFMWWLLRSRDRFEEVLRKNMSMLEKAQEIGQMGSWEWDIATNELVWSDEVYKLYGLDPAKDCPKYDVVINNLTPETRDWFLKAIDDALKHGMPFDGEYGLIRPDGTRRYTHTRGEVIRDNEGNPVRMFGMVRDITESQQAQERLQLFRNLIDQSNDAFFVNDPETGRILDANDRACLNLGYERNELLNMHVLDFEVTLPDQFSWKEHVKEVRSKGHLTVEGRHRRKDGTIFPVEVNISFVVLEKISYMVAVVHDITERQQAEGALRESRDFSEKLIDSLRDGLSVFNKDGVRIKVNKAFSGMTGYTEDELINGKPPFPFWPPEHMKDIREAFKIMMQGNMRETEMVFMRRNGERFPVLVSASYMRDEHGRITNLINSIKDITERKLAEKQIIASLKEKEVLLREIHHRVKNNMQIVSSLLWLQSEHVRDKKDIEIFKDSQNRIMSMSLVHEKLYRSKDLAGIDTNGYITDLTYNLFQSYGVKAGIIALNISAGNVSLGIDSSIPCGLIINELVTNSLKYAFPDGRKGEISVSFRNLNENMIELAVSDNGVGIPDDVDFRKTGSLGLRLVTILTENQLHGEITLDRSRGTEFKIIFKGVK